MANRVWRIGMGTFKRIKKCKAKFSTITLEYEEISQQMFAKHFPGGGEFNL